VAQIILVETFHNKKEKGLKVKKINWTEGQNPKIVMDYKEAKAQRKIQTKRPSRPKMAELIGSTHKDYQIGSS
jgi:Spy/CpxP family protein refolding chaperone